MFERGIIVLKCGCLMLYSKKPLIGCGSTWGQGSVASFLDIAKCREKNYK